MDAYVYQAALLCEDCAGKVKADLDQHREAGAHCRARCEDEHMAIAPLQRAAQPIA